MSTDPTQPPTTVELLKSEVPWALAPSGFGVAAELPWPLSPTGLLQLYLNSPEHCRAVHVKAAGGFGAGLEFERDQDAARIGSLIETSTGDLGEDVGIDWETYGNAFLELVRDSRARLTAIRRLPAVTMIRQTEGRATQRIVDGYGVDTYTQFQPGETLQLRQSCPGGTWYSFPDWIGGHGMMELAQAAIEFNRRFFENSAIPEYAVISTGFELTQEQKQATRDFFRGQFKGVYNTHRTLYLHLPDKEHAIEFKRITSDLKDADFLKLLDAARDRMPIAHGVPPRVMGILSAGGLGGAGEVTGQLHTFELLTLAPRRARMLAQWMPIFRELGVKITADRPEVRWRGIDLTPPAQTDDSNLAAWVQAGILTPEEGRALLEADRAGLTKSDGPPDPTRTRALIRLLMAQR